MTFEINGKNYEAAPIDFNTVAEMSLNDVDILSGNKIPIAATLRAYFAVCAGTDTQTAGRELTKHLANGGNLASLMAACQSGFEESGFFNRPAKPEKAQ